MNTKEFRCLLALLLQSDTFDENDPLQETLMNFIDNESKKRGYDNCRIAYDALIVLDKPKPKRKVRKARGKKS